MEHKKTKGKFGEVHYWISNKQKETIVFIHGALMDHNQFSEQVDYFSKNFTVVTVDLPWHGLSVPYSPFGLKNAADEVVKILKEENLTNVNLVGQSMGGLIGQIICYDYPEVVQTLTVIGSAPLQLKYYKEKKSMKFERFVTSLFTYSFLIKMMAKKVSISNRGRAYIHKVMKQHTKSKLLDIMMKIPEDATLQLRDNALTISLLITYGDNDETTGIKSNSNQWAKNEYRELKVLKNASHNANLDNPSLFNEVLNNFLFSANNF